jgi:tRNA(His) 5'-end guanylyltransferase
MINIQFFYMKTNVQERPAAFLQGQYSASISDITYFKSAHIEITEYYSLNCKCLHYKHPEKYIPFKEVMSWKQELRNTKYWLLTAGFVVLTKTKVFCKMTPCRMPHRYGRFGKRFPHL